MRTPHEAVATPAAVRPARQRSIGRGPYREALKYHSELFPISCILKDSASKKSTTIWHLESVVPVRILRRFRRPLGSIGFYALLMLTRYHGAKAVAVKPTNPDHVAVALWADISAGPGKGAAIAVLSCQGLDRDNYL